MITKLTHEEIRKAKPSVETVKNAKRMPLYVVLDNIRSLHNVGAIFRTADGILAEKLFLCGITGHPPRKEIEKAALGAVGVVPWEYSPSTKETLLKLKKMGVKICVLELTENSIDFKKAEYSFPMALLIGNEIFGVSDNVMHLADMAISIPMLGRANSLNVSTAFGVAGYEILAQYTDRKT